MKKVVLIIDDDAAIRQALADRLESAGYDFDLSESQVEAMEFLGKQRYDVVLLDLELPTRKGKPTATQVGRNLLDQIRACPRNGSTPVIMVTNHGGEGPETAVDLMAQGANYFIHKMNLGQLENSIKRVLTPKVSLSSPVSGAAQSNAPLQPFDGGDLEFTDQGVAINGIHLAGRTSTIYGIIRALCETNGKGRRQSLSGQALADRLNLTRGQVAIGEAVSAFRTKAVGELRKAGFEADHEGIIITGRSGYELAQRIRTQEAIATTAGEPQEVLPEQRQRWVIEQLESGRKLKRNDLETHFGICTTTAKRYLKALDHSIEFTAGPKGYYRLKKRPTSQKEPSRAAALGPNRG
jgi:CheY-like chemotaxis protein/biotin operon repressor